MNDDTQSGRSRLDNIRLTEGPDRCQAVFNETCQKDKAAASALINDQRLTFPSLFILLPQIESFRLHPHLSSIKKNASQITAQILKPTNAGYLTQKSNAEYAALKWILETGKPEDGLNDDFDEVLDICVSVLINLYRDKSILPAVADMIFTRAGKGRDIHNLTWAYFRITDPYALKLLAQRIASPRDSGLACNLLNIDADTSREKQAEAYLRWLDDNSPFLYFTDESFQMSSSPAFYRVDLERKYIQKSASSYVKQQVVPSDNIERRCLKAFRSLEDKEKQILSDYSHKTHGDLSKWKTWMALPVDEQIAAARQGREDV